jgi:single-strand DNA-binding protein
MDKIMALPTITAQGNLVFEPEFQVTQSGISRCKMRIACNERRKNQDGTWSDGETSYFDIVLWRGLAEAAADQFKKGQPILVVGKVRVSKYEDKNGIERTVVEITADEIAAVVKANKVKEANADVDPWL